MHANQFLRMPEVIRLCSLSRSQIYRLESAGLFPKKVKISLRASAWVAGEVQEWIKSRIDAR
jgi:prophage regulatory protein